MPALHPDVAVIHCQRADARQRAGLGTFRNPERNGVRVEAGDRGCRRDRRYSVIRRDPNRTLIPSIIVDHVVHEPWGAHPSYVQGFYDRDNEFYVKWEDISETPATYQDYLNEFVYGVKDRAAYIKSAVPLWTESPGREIANVGEVELWFLEIHGPIFAFEKMVARACLELADHDVDFRRHRTS